MTNLAKCSCPLVLSALISITPAVCQVNTKRVALVIGAQGYTELPPLRNSLNDARAVTASLKAKGFSVRSLYDPKTKRELKESVDWYFRQMANEEGAVGIIYYAGHGMQHEGDNYVIPVTASLANPGDLEDYCLRMNSVMAILTSASKSLNILILDACRTLPSFTRGTGEGLVRMEAPEGSIVVFAAQAGKVASDGGDGNGLFTSRFLRAINEPDLTISAVLQKVKRDVYEASGRRQLPSVEDNATGGEFYFTRSSTLSASVSGLLPGLRKVITPATPGSNFGYGTGATSFVMIGSKHWVSKNLNTDRFANGDSILEATSIEEWTRAAANRIPAWCYYDNEQTNGNIFGRLYNGYAVTDPRGLCPAGTHVPTDEEWKTMIDFVGPEAGRKLKATLSWSDGGNGLDEMGFAGLSGGSRSPDGHFSSVGATGYWWSSTVLREDWVFRRFVSHTENDVARGASPRGSGLSVRCIKD